MHTYYEKIPLGENYTCYVKALNLEQFDAPRHFHPEYEIMFVEKSCGKRFVGDNISEYKEGDLVLLGPNLPHYWYKDPDIGRYQPVKATVIQFKLDFMENGFLEKTEMQHIKKMLEKASRGLKFCKATSNNVSPELKQLQKAKGFEKVLRFLNILHHLSISGRIEILCSPGYKPDATQDDSKKIGQVYQYILNHFRKEVNLEKAALLAGMNKSAFCHFFKKRTRKNFSQFVNEMRIGHASRLLIETELSVSEICYASGFKNLSNFNRRFKEINLLSPINYRHQLQQENIAPRENFQHS